jgi:transcriptional regulator with XRE-family HTH domain
MPTAGPTLRIERLRANLTATALAAQMGLSRQALWALERAARVTPERVTAYREAVKTLRDDKDEAA